MATAPEQYKKPPALMPWLKSSVRAFGALVVLTCVFLARPGVDIVRSLFRMGWLKVNEAVVRWARGINNLVTALECNIKVVVANMIQEQKLLTLGGIRL
jgi:hypothetical protein